MATLTREDWTVAALKRLASGGIDDVRVEPLAKDLGVSKGSFYWHFEDRAALLSSMLTYWRERGTQAIIDQVEAATASPRERVAVLLHAVFGETRGDRTEIALRAWAGRDDGARETVRTVDDQRTQYVAGLLIAAGVPASEARLRTNLVYRTLLGDFLLRRSGGEALTTDGIDALVRLALD